MKRILVGGAGGTPSNGFIQSLREAPESFYIIGMTSNPYDLCKAKTDERYLDPYAHEKDYYLVLEDVIRQTKPDFLHIQNDIEVHAISKYREKIKELGVKTFLPRPESIEVCIDKLKSYKKWQKAGLKVPKTILIETEEDLKKAFRELSHKIWIRALRGAAGKGSLPTDNYQLAKAWIDFFDGWGKFSAAETLTPRTVTWLSMWKNGELIVAQGRERLYWEFANRTLSGVTGITGTGVTISDSIVDEIAQKAILVIDSKPNGIWAVDMTYDKNGIPNLTEINIGRFFTTHLFFTRAGLNMPYILIKLAFNEELPPISKKINPLPPGLAWVRGMDTEPVLTTFDKINKFKEDLEKSRRLLWKKD
jgi:carbamoyl-phosphate synthase large subunit